MTDRVETIRNLCRRCTLRQIIRRTLSLVVLVSLPLLARAADQPLTNADVVKVVQAKLAPRVILQMITSAPSCNFALAATDLIELKRQGVPDDVIGAMLDRQAKPAATKTAATTTSAAAERSVLVHVVKGGRQDWPLWSRRAGEGAAVGVLLLPDAALQTDADAVAAVEAYNTTEQGVLVVGGGRDTFSFYSMDCYRYHADSCNKWDRVQFEGAKWEPPSQVTVPLSANAASISAIAVIRYPDGKLVMLPEDSWVAQPRWGNYASCTTRAWAVTTVRPGTPLTLTALMDIDYKRPLGIVSAVRLCPSLSFN